jgi:hypothetical protein
MKRTVVLKKIAKAAKTAGVEFSTQELTNPYRCDRRRCPHHDRSPQRGL